MGWISIGCWGCDEAASVGILAAPSGVVASCEIRVFQVETPYKFGNTGAVLIPEYTRIRGEEKRRACVWGILGNVHQRSKSVRGCFGEVTRARRPSQYHYISIGLHL